MSKLEPPTEKAEILRDVQVAERQLSEGQGIPHKEARQRVLARLIHTK